MTDPPHPCACRANAPGFAAVSMVTLGAGLGASTAVFSVVNGVLPRPLPYPDAKRIVRVQQVGDGPAVRDVSGPNFEDWRTQSRSFETLAVYAGGPPVSVLSDGQPNRASVLFVSAPYLDVLGVRPMPGRSFLENEFSK